MYSWSSPLRYAAVALCFGEGGLYGSGAGDRAKTTHCMGY